MTSETKEFDPAILASITTGILMVQPFSAMCEAAEWIAGHPIWTHEYPSMSDRLKHAVLEQFPDMPTNATPENWETVRDAVREQYGETIPVAKGSGERDKGPIATAIEIMGQRH